MKKIIDGYTYDTDESELLGVQCGPADGSYWFKLWLYEMPGSGHFEYREGGPMSLSPEPQIRDLTPDDAHEWLQAV